MPIYEYQCGACGQLQEFLQKMSDAPRTRCVHCGEEALTKRVTAAGFQLKGSGWYVTDFRNGGSKPDTKSSASAPKPDGKSAAAGEGGTSSSAAPAAAPAGASPASGA